MLNNPNETTNLQASSLDEEMAVDIPNLDEASTNRVAKPSMGPSMPAPSSMNSEAVDMFDGIPSLSPAEEATAPIQPNNQNVLAARPEKKFSVVGLLLIIIIIIALLGGALAAYNFWANSNGEAELDNVEENIMMENGSYDNAIEDDLQPNLPSAEDLGINENDFIVPEEEEVVNLETDIFLPPLSEDKTDVLEYQEENEITDESSEVDENLSGNEETGFVELSPEEQPAEITFPEAELDYDNDALTNAEEASLGTSPYKADTDNDMLNDREEVMIYNTDPLNPDSDGDSYLDGAEVAAGYNPNGPGKLNE